jgi:PAS domain S-box-containing protein
MVGMEQGSVKALRQRLMRLVDIALGAGLAFAVIVGVSTLLPGDVHWAVWLAVMGFVLLVALISFVMSRRVSVLERSSMNTGLRLVGEIKRREKVEAALREEELFPHLNPGPVVRFDAEGRITRWNNAALELIGEDRLKGGRILELVDGFMPEDLKTCIERGVVEPREQQWHDRWYMCHLRGLPEQRLGVLYASDITALKESEMQVRAMEERTRAILDSAADGICIVIPGGIIRNVNPATEKLFGIEHDDVVGRNIEMLLPDLFEGKTGDRQEILAELAGKRPTGPIEEVHYGVRGDGTRFPVSLAVSRFEVQEYPRVTCIIRDISERIEAQTLQREQARMLKEQNRALEQLVTELNEFNYVASHDLNEPLRTMSTYCGLLKADVESGRQDRALEDAQVILDASLRMQRLIKDLLEYSQSGHSALKPCTVSLENLVKRVCKDLKARIDETGGKVEFHDLPDVSGDELQLGRVLQNLVANGLKFKRPDVSPVVQISAERNNGLIRLSVEDNGIGIEPEYAEQVFKPFKRLHGAGRYEGTGIGLAVCRKIVERHGGKIFLDAPKDEGSRFVVELPADARPQYGDTSQARQEPKREHHGGNHDD